jgi:hypothetical protein
MSSEISANCSLFEHLSPVAHSEGTEGMRAFVLLPSLEELLGQPGFGHCNPIFLPGHARPLNGWALFGSVRDRGLALH